MNTDHHAAARLSPQELAALMDEAKLRAVGLRREAIAEFWAALSRCAHSVGHALRRGLPRASLGH